MKPRYLLPCSCGREIPIEVGQAGQVVHCQCGATLEAPTLLRLKSLKRVVEEVSAETRRKPRWGLRQRLALLGMAIAVPFLILAAISFVGRPRRQAVLTYAPLDSLTYVQTWQVWQDLQRGVGRRPNTAETLFSEALKFNHRWIAIFLAVAGVGIMLTMGSLFIKRQPRRPMEQKAVPRP